MGQVLTRLTIVAVSHDGSSIKVALSCVGSAEIDLTHPFTGKQEDLLKWYLQDYALKEPFEVTKAENVEASLAQYGRNLASQIWDAQVIPTGSNLEIHVQLGSDPSAPPSAVLQALRWEILEDISYWPSNSGIKQVAVKRVLPQSHAAATSIPRNPSIVLNVLMVVARPDHDADANHRLISRPFMKAISKLPQGQGAVVVKPVFVRPATWEKFLEELREPEVGYYQLVHFDMHGKVKKVDGKYSAYLDFVELSNDSKSKVVKDRIGAASVADALVESGVQVVILNACESAKADSEVSDGGNLAETFVRAGVPTVVAMSYQILDTAAEIFMESLYDSLLVKNHDISSAICNARTALANQPIRKGRFSHQLKLLDTIVPVLYQAEDSFFKLPQNQSPMPGGSSQLTSVFQLEENDNIELLGRDINILDLELLLVRRKLLLLHGPGGCGKTTFLKYICWWWKTTGYVEDYIYFDLSTMRAPGITLETVLAEIAKALFPHGTSEHADTEQNIIKMLVNRRYLLVFDSFEVTTTSVWLDMVTVPEAQRDRLRSFLKKAEAGKTSILISSRLPECWLATLSAEEMYPLGGLPVPSAIQLADSVARANRKDAPIYATNRESLEFLQRVIILLEGNPLAIETLFSAAQLTGVTPTSIYYNILAGEVILQPGLHMRHRFVNTISKMLEQMNIQRERMSGLDSGVSLIYAEPFLAAFWGVFPEDMRVFYYLISLNFWVSDVELPPDRIGARNAKWLEGVYKTQETFKYNHYVPPSLRELKKAALIEPATVTTNASDEVSYHLHPLFTLWMRKSLNGQGLEVSRRAMVEFLIFKNMHYKQGAAVKSVTWGCPAVVQHTHFCYVKSLAAIGSALESDLKAELEWHGVDFVYGLVLPLTDILWFRLEIGTVLQPYFKRHLNRFLALKPHWQDGIPPPWDLGQILQLTLYLGKLVDDSFKKLLPMCLDMVDNFTKAGRKMQSWTETSWFELRLQEGLVALDEGREEKAREIFERNLRDNPSEDNDLMPAIRRLQVQNLQNWTGLLLDETLVSNNETEATKVAPPKKLHSRRLLDSLLDPEQMEEVKTMPVGSGYGSILETHQDVVATFGQLTKAILAEPLDSNYLDLAPKGIFDPESRKTLTSSFSSGERTMGFISDMTEADLRSRVGYTKDAVRLLERLLQKQTGDDWRAEAEIHRRLHCIAFEQGDLKKAIAHLDVQRELAERESDHEMRCCLLLRYAECHDKLGESVVALKYVAKAAQVAETYDEELIKQVVAGAQDIKAMEMFMERSQSGLNMDGLTDKEYLLLVEVTKFIELLCRLDMKLKSLQTHIAIHDTMVGGS